MNGAHTELIHVCIAALDCLTVFTSTEGVISSINPNEIKNLELVQIKQRKAHQFILYINIFKHNRLFSL